MIDDCLKDVPKPQSSEERVFIPFQRCSKIQKSLLKWLTIGGSSISAIMIILAILFYMNISEQALTIGQSDKLAEARILLMLFTIIILTLCVSFGLFYFFMQRVFFNTFIIVNPKGVTLHTARKKTFIEWQFLKKVRTIAMGRMQQCTLIDQKGNKISFVANMIDAWQPIPKMKMNLKGFLLEYPDKTRILLKIKENPLYLYIQERMPRLG